jgi:hypothetical protein
MFLICLLLIGLIVVATIAANEPSIVEQAEFIPVPVRDNYTLVRYNPATRHNTCFRIDI